MTTSQRGNEEERQERDIAVISAGYLGELSILSTTPHCAGGKNNIVTVAQNRAVM